MYPQEIKKYLIGKHDKTLAYNWSFKRYKYMLYLKNRYERFKYFPRYTGIHDCFYVKSGIIKNGIPVYCYKLYTPGTLQIKVSRSKYLNKNFNNRKKHLN